MVKKSIRLLLFVIMITISLSFASACNSKHEHTYEDGWLYDETYHWRKATCGDIDIGLKSKHNFIDNKCTLCGYEKDAPINPNQPINPDDPDDPDNPTDPNKPNRPDPSNPDNPTDPDDPTDPEDPDNPRPGGEGEPEQGDDGLTYTLTLDLEETGYAVSAGSKNSGNIEIPATYKSLPVVKIEDNGFKGCSISSIKIPNSVKAIGAAAFYNCKSLTSITIPNSVTFIDSQAFRDCTALREINLSENLGEIFYQTFYNCSALQTLTIPDKVTNVWRYAFYGCSSLTELTVGKSVTSFGQMNFMNCNKLSKVNITDLDAWCGISFYDCWSNPLYLAHYLYLNGTPVKEVTFPDNIEHVSQCLFLGCYSIEEVTFSDKMTSIGFDAFDSCINLKKVDFGKCQIKTISDQIFYKCTSLTSIVLPDSLEDTARGLFEGCRSLNNVVLGRNIKTIGMYTFKDCDALNSINYKGSPEEWNQIRIASNWTGEHGKNLAVNYNYKEGN